MATTRQNLRRNLSYLSGDFILDPDGSVPTCSSQGGASGATAIDALLSYYDDDYFNEWFFVLPSGPSGSGSYEATRVTDFTSSTGTLELEPNASTQIANAQAYELHRYHPAWKHLALNAARLQAADVLYLAEPDETLVVDNLLTGWDFEASGLTGWTQTAGTWTQETTRVAHGSGSATATASGADAQLTQNIFTSVNIKEVVSKTLYIRAWVFATAANAARLRVTFDGGTTFTNGTYHGGSDEWENGSLQYINVNVPADATSMTIYCEIADGNTAYFDAVVAWIGHVNRYDLPTNFYRDPTMVEQQANASEPNGEYHKLTKHNLPSSGTILRLTGKRLLSEVTTEAGTMEVSEPEDQILYAHALEWLVRSNIGMASGVAREQFLVDRQLWRETAAELRIRVSIKPPVVPIYAEQNGVWKVQWDGETGYLLLTNR